MRNWTTFAVFALFLIILSTLLAGAQDKKPFDIIVRNGHIIDGTGSPWYSGDLGIRDGKIAAIGNLAQAASTRTIDAHGLVVAPGFIDMLGQSELTILVSPQLPSKIFQGITTEITGEGGSAAPLNDAIIKADHLSYEHLKITPDWRTFRQYAPAPYATTDELIALATEAGKFGGIYATHMRSEGDAITGAIDEAIRIGREAHIPVEIWHIKSAGKPNWGRMPEIISQIDKARAAGVDIGANTYAYPAWFNSFSAFIPPWAHDGGEAKMIERLRDPALRARIRKEMETPSSDWDNEWHEVPGPEAILVSVVQNPKSLPLQG